MLDTNVLISSLLFGGNPREILERVIRGELILCISESIMSELSTVLQRSKFGFPPAVASQIAAELSSISELVLPSETIQEIVADDADNRVLECAAEAHADYIVAGDTHLLQLELFRSISVVSSQQFLAILKK